MFIIYIEILRYFEISNFLVSDWLTHSLTLTRPRGTFAPENRFKNNPPDQIYVKIKETFSKKQFLINNISIQFLHWIRNIVFAILSDIKATNEVEEYEKI